MDQPTATIVAACIAVTGSIVVAVITTRSKRSEAKTPPTSLAQTAHPLDASKEAVRAFQLRLIRYFFASLAAILGAWGIIASIISLIHGDTSNMMESFQTGIILSCIAYFLFNKQKYFGPHDLSR
jgi:hypothetical protein